MSKSSYCPRSILQCPRSTVAVSLGALLLFSCGSGNEPSGGDNSGGGGESSLGSGGRSEATGGLGNSAGGAVSSGGASGGTAGAGGGGSSSGGQGSGGADGSGGSASLCTPQGQARNPIVSHIFTADPSAKVFGDRVYVYTSHDADGQTDFDMIDYHAYSSDDMANWQDHGVIIKASDLSWAQNLYAPDACEKDGRYYLYMPNSGSGIGVAVSDDPGGPFVDPLGEPLVTKSTGGVGDVDWLFDPACFVDDDGQGYLYFGGGPENTGDNARVMRLNDDMISLEDTTATTIVAPQFFEASFMHKRGSTYYFSYSTNFVGHSAYLDYMTSDNPMSGFAYQGTILSNGNINSGNNNHGSVIEFMGKSYLFYHNRKLEQDGGGDNVYQRSVAIQELTYDAAGAITQMEMSTEDTTIDQIKCLDGFTEIQAETIAAQNGIEVEGNGTNGVSVTSIEDGDWVGYSQVDFAGGANSWTGRVASNGAGGTIEIYVDGCDDFTSEPGTLIGSCAVTDTGGADTFADLSCDIEPTTGPHDLCLFFTGTASFKVDSFHFE